MRTGPATGREGFFHEAVIYGSDDELFSIVVPHLQAAVAAGEPAFVSLPDHEAALVRAAFGHAPGVTYLPALTGQRPPDTIRRVSALLRELTADGVEQVRLVDTVPHPGLRAPWDGWCRYEAVVNQVLADLPVWGMCLYDRRLTAAHVLADVERTHPHLGTSDGNHLPNSRYQDPETFVHSMAPPPDPLEANEPIVELVDPLPRTVRNAVRDAAEWTHLTREEIENLTIAASESITNAIIHGQPPTMMKLWTTLDRVVVTVNDRGPGPQDPCIGLVPSSAVDGSGGYGLWIAHQLVAVTFVRRPDGFTIRLAAGAPVT